MEKILAIVVLVIVVWWAIPHIAHGEWIAPTAVQPNSWVTNYNVGQGYTGDNATQYAADAAQPSEGYGWFRFDFWNNPSPDGRPSTQSDFRLQHI